MADSRKEEFEERDNPPNEIHVRDEEAKRGYQNSGKGSQPVQSLMACYRTDLPSVEDQLEVAKKRKATQIEDRHKQLDAEYHQKLQKALERKKEHDREEKERIYREARKEQSKRAAVLERKKQQEEEKKKQMMAEYEKRQKQHQAAEERRLQISKSSSPKVIKNQHSPPQLKKSNRELQKSMTTGDVRKSQKVSSKLKSSTSASSVGPVSSQRNSNNGKSTKPSTQPSRPQSTIKPSTQPSSLSHTPTVKPSHSHSTTSSSSPPSKPKQLTSTPKTHLSTSKVQSVKKTSTSSPQEQKKAVHSTQSPKLRKKVSQPSPATKVTVKKSLSHSGQKASSPRSARKEHHSKEMMSASDHHPEEMTSTSDHHLEEMTSTSDHHLEEMTSTSDHHLEEMTSTSDHHPEEMTSTSDHHPEEMTSTSDHHPEEMTSTSDHHPEEMTSTSDHHPEEMTSTSDHHPEEMTSTSDHHPEEMTSTSDHHPEEMTSTSDHHLEETTSATEIVVKDETAQTVPQFEDVEVGQSSEELTVVSVVPSVSVSQVTSEGCDVDGNTLESLDGNNWVQNENRNRDENENRDETNGKSESLYESEKLDLSRCQNENENLDKDRTAHPQRTKSLKHVSSASALDSKHSFGSGSLDVPTAVFRRHSDGPSRERKRVVLDRPLVLPVMSATPQLPQDEKTEQSMKEDGVEVPLIVHPLRLSDASVNELEEGEECSDEKTEEDVRRTVQSAMVDKVIAQTLEEKARLLEKLSMKKSADSALWPARGGTAGVHNRGTVDVGSNHSTVSVVEDDGGDVVQNPTKALHRMQSDPDIPPEETMDELGEEVRIRKTSAPALMTKKSSVDFEGMQISAYSGPLDHLPPYTESFESLDNSMGEHLDISPINQTTTAISSEMFMSTPFFQDATGGGFDAVSNSDLHEDSYQFRSNVGDDVVSDSDEDDSYQLRSNVIMDDVVSDSDEDDSYQLRSDVVDEVVSDSDEDDSYQLRSDFVDEVVSDSNDDDSYQLRSDVVDEVVSGSDEDDSYQLPSNVVVDEVISDSDEDESYQLRSNVVDDVVSDSDEDENAQKLPSFKMLPKKDSFILFKDTLSPPSPKDVETLFDIDTAKKDSIVLPPIALPPPPLKGILKSSRSKDTHPASTTPTSTTIPIDEIVSSDGEDNDDGRLKASNSPVGYSSAQLEADSTTVNATLDSGGDSVRSGSTWTPHSHETRYQDVLCSSDDSEDEDNEIHDNTHPLAITSGLPTSPPQPSPPVGGGDGSISHDTGGTVHGINTEQTTVERVVPMDDVLSSSDSDELVADSYELVTSIPVIQVQHPSTGDSNQEDEPPVSPPGHHEVVGIGSKDDIRKETTAGQVSNSDSDTGFADSVPSSLKFGSGAVYSDEVVSSSESEGDLFVY